MDSIFVGKMYGDVELWFTTAQEDVCNSNVPIGTFDGYYVILNAVDIGAGNWVYSVLDSNICSKLEDDGQLADLVQGILKMIRSTRAICKALMQRKEYDEDFFTGHIMAIKLGLNN